MQIDLPTHKEMLLYMRSTGLSDSEIGRRAGFHGSNIPRALASKKWQPQPHVVDGLMRAYLIRVREMEAIFAAAEEAAK